MNDPRDELREEQDGLHFTATVDTSLSDEAIEELRRRVGAAPVEREIRMKRDPDGRLVLDTETYSEETT